MHTFHPQKKNTSAHQVDIVSSVSERVWLARSKTDKMIEAKNEKAWKFKKTLPVKQALLLPLKHKKSRKPALQHQTSDTPSM